MNAWDVRRAVDRAEACRLVKELVEHAGFELNWRGRLAGAQRAAAASARR